MNPPYKKLGRSSRERRLVEDAATDVSNLYTAFLALSVNLLNPDGQLAAITPRSFANGAYFRSFRRFFLNRMHLDRVHVFESRSTVFGDSDVLQENIIFAASRRPDIYRRPVIISTSTGYHDAPKTRRVSYEEMVDPNDQECFIHISGDAEDRALAAILERLPARLSDLGLKISTGRVVDFRAKEHLREEPDSNTAPLIYPLHMREGRVRWPVHGARKPNAIASNDDTAKLMFPSGNYVIVKRMSSKEERRRVVAAMFDEKEIPCETIGFENHVNVFHKGGSGLPSDLAKGLCLWLNSTVLDRFIRRFNGHTQINATDLRNLSYPALEELSRLGEAWGSGSWPDQDKIDHLVLQHVAACQTGADDSDTT
jgi:adenine-specific DNA-methyltransferase